MNVLRIDTGRIKEFQNNNATKVKIGNEAMASFQSLVNSILHSEVGFSQHLLIQDLNTYSKECLIYCMRGEANMALVMLRIFAEKTRDLYRILEDPSRETIFLHGRKSEEKKQRREFVETFKFQLPEENYLYGIYNFASDFGVHSRMPILEEFGLVKEYDEMPFVELSQNKQAVEVFMISLSTNFLTIPVILKKAYPYISKNENAEKYAIQARSLWEKGEKNFDTYLKIWKRK